MNGIVGRAQEPNRELDGDSYGETQRLSSTMVGYGP